MNEEIDELIVKAGIGINNSLQNRELQQMLAVFGITEEKLNVGKGLLDEAAALNNQQTKETGDWRQATDDLGAKTDAAFAPYITLVKVARIAFAQEPGAWTALGLAGDRKRSQSGLLAQLNQFYTNLSGNTEWLEKMAGYGITAEKLAVAKALALEAEEALNRQKVEMGEAQDATLRRDRAADTLQEWYSDFIAIARIALEDNPQYLEMLGIVKK